MPPLHNGKPAQAYASWSRSAARRNTMKQQQLRFDIKDKVEVDVDFARQKAVISCETEDGKRVHFQINYETLEKIHQVIRDKLSV
jgi:hypothetical protein